MSDATSDAAASTTGPWSRLALACVIAWAFVMSCTPLVDFDIWWHLRTAELITQRGTVPFGDWFTFTENDAAWVDLHWGFQLLARLIYGVAGVPGLVLATAFALSATVAIGLFSSGQPLHPSVRVAIWSLAAIGLSGRALARPELVTIVGLAVWLWIFERQKTHPRWLWFLPLVQWLWSNCHALSVLGLVIAGAFTADIILRRQFGSADVESGQPSIATLAKLWAMLILVSFANPYLEEGTLFPLVLFQKLSSEQAFYATRIDEFMPPLVFFMQSGFRSWHFDAVMLLWLVAAVSFGVRAWLPASGAKSVMRVDCFKLLLFVAFSFLGWKMLRNLSLLVVIAANVAVDNWAATNGDELRKRLLPTWLKQLREGSLSARLLMIEVAVMLALGVSHVTGHWGRWSGSFEEFGLNERTNWFAHRAALFAGQPGMPDRAFVSNIGQAGVFIFHNSPQRLVFMDGRLEVCSRRTFETFELALAQMAKGDPSFSNLLGGRDDHGQLPSVVLDTRASRASILGMLRVPTWRMVFADEVAVVFIESALADKLRLPAVAR